MFAHPDDRERVLSLLAEENVMDEVERSGIFTLGYRIMTGGKPVNYQLKAAMVEEKEGLRLVVGLNDIDARTRARNKHEFKKAQENWK